MRSDAIGFSELRFGKEQYAEQCTAPVFAFHGVVSKSRMATSPPFRHSNSSVETGQALL
jgi:hypothetical protein